MSTLTESQFQHIADLAKERWGLALTPIKKQLVSNRMTKLLRRKPFEDVDAYLDFLRREGSPADLLEFFDALSTNVTSFFREIAHFHFLERELYAPLSGGTMTRPGRRLRMWSAACSTGAEPYTMAIHAREHLRDFDAWDLRILATDLSNKALDQCRRAVYPQDMVRDLDRDLVSRSFERGRGSMEGQVRVRPELRSLVSIAQLNLMDPWPMKGPFDVIFCRNVMIYFDAPTKERIVNRMHELLRPGGWLVIGSAETLSGLNTPYESVGPTVYRK